MFKRMVFGFGVALLLVVTTTLPVQAVSVLNFEGVNATYPSDNFAQVLNFYNGGTSSAGTSGTNYGITFSDNALALCLNEAGVDSLDCSNTSRGGFGDPNSQRGGLVFGVGAETFMSSSSGFTTGVSLLYTAINDPGSLNVYDGVNGTGNVLATLVLPITASSCDISYDATFCPFVAAGVSFAGTALSIGFAGVADQIVFDDVTFVSATPGNGVPEPASLLLLGSGLMGLIIWRRKQMA